MSIPESLANLQTVISRNYDSCYQSKDRESDSVMEPVVGRPKSLGLFSNQTGNRHTYRKSFITKRSVGSEYTEL